MKEKKKNARGITLIALVVTIVVLLILAGIAINALVGDHRNTKKSSTSQRKNDNIQKSRRSKISVNRSNNRKWRRQREGNGKRDLRKNQKEL